MSSQLQPVPFSQLATYADKQPIPAVCGTLVTLYPLKTTKKDGSPMPYPKREGVLKDGNLEHRVAFDEKCNVQDDLKGKRILISSTISTKGMTGIKMDRYSQDAKWHNVSVTSSATIEIVGATTGQPVNSPQTASTGFSGPPPTPSRPQELPPSERPVEARIGDWFKVFDLVCQYAGKDREEMIAGFTPTDLKEITTGQVMSFKGQYGMFAPVVFGITAQVTETQARMEAQVARAEVAGRDEESPPLSHEEPSALGWRTFVYKNRALGDYTKEEINRFIAWAETNEPTGVAGKSLKSALLSAKAERDAPSVSYRDGLDDSEIPF